MTYITGDKDLLTLISIRFKCVVSPCNYTTFWF